MARKYFDNKNPVGETLRINSKELVITGKISDPPPNTHLKFGFIASLHGNEMPEWMRKYWDVNMIYTYLKFRPGTDISKTLREIETGANKNRKIEPEEKITYFLTPIKDIHLHSHVRGELAPPGNPTYLIIFGISALFIVLIACINCINLTTAQSLNRAKEVGLRKTIGAIRGQLVAQFMGESLIMTILAVLLACMIVMASLPLLRRLVDIPDILNGALQTENVLCLFGITLFTGLIAGTYPAFFLSRFNPISALKGQRSVDLKGKGLRRFMVVFQFAISVIIFTGAIVIFQQIHYMKNKNLGFTKEQKLIIPIREGVSIKENYKTMKEEFLKQSGIHGATVSSAVPGRIYSSGLAHLVGESEDISLLMYRMYVDLDFIDEYGIELAAGRPFQRERISDKERTLLINETAAVRLGFSSPGMTLGRTITLFGERREVIGVVKDFHFFGLQNEIESLIIICNPTKSYFITLTLSTDAISRTLSVIEKTWSKTFPAFPLEYFFLDADFDSFYHQEEKVAKLVGMFSLIAIFIACLGILGLAANTTQQRTKEIGIRKVIGASSSRITALLTGEYAKWILFANIIAWPAAYFVLNRWLAGFAFRTAFSVWYFIIPSIITLGLAVFIVSYHTIKAAVANPVDSLKYE
jgi:putative ABC transport system permease protein